MNTTTRPAQPEIDYESLYLMLGSHYDFNAVYDDKQNHWFIEITRIGGIDN